MEVCVNTELVADKKTNESGHFNVKKSVTFLVLRFLNHLKQCGRSAHTISAYRNDLGMFSQFLKVSTHSLEDIGSEIAEEWAHYLLSHGRKSAASQRRAFMSVRSFMHFLVSNSYLHGSPFLNRKSPDQPKNAPFAVQPKHFARVIKNLEILVKRGDEKGIRDLSLVLVLGECGLKASEVAALQWADIEWRSQKRHSIGRGKLIVRKGHRPRLIPFSAQTGRALFALHELSAARIPAEQLPLASVFFGYQNVSRQVSNKNLQRHSIKFIIYEICADNLGISYNAESFRNHAILNWLKKGLNGEQIADLAGYSSLSSLERFVTLSSTLGEKNRAQEVDGRQPCHERQPTASADWPL